MSVVASAWLPYLARKTNEKEENSTDAEEDCDGGDDVILLTVRYYSNKE